MVIVNISIFLRSLDSTVEIITPKPDPGPLQGAASCGDGAESRRQPSLHTITLNVGDVDGPTPHTEETGTP